MKTLKKGIALSLALMLCLSLTSVNVWAEYTADAGVATVSTLADLQDALANDDVQTVLISSYIIDIPDGTEINLNGKTVEIADGVGIGLRAKNGSSNTDRSTLTIKDDTGNGVIKNLGATNAVVQVYARSILNLEGVTIIGNGYPAVLMHGTSSVLNISETATVTGLVKFGTANASSASTAVVNVADGSELETDAPVSIAKTKNGETSLTYVGGFSKAFGRSSVLTTETDTDAQYVLTVRCVNETSDFTTPESVTLSNGLDITLDLGRFTMPRVLEVASGSVTVKNGTLTRASSRANGPTLTVSGGTVTIEDGAIIDKGSKENSIEATSGELVITGGIITGNLSIADEVEATITGGTFSNSPSAYVPASCEIAEGETFTVSKLTSGVAKIGDDYYPTLDAAIAAATAGQTVTLLSDASLGKTEFNKNLILDLGDRTLTLTAAEALQAISGGDVTVKNGTIRSDKDDIISAKGGKITLGESLTVEAGSSAIYAYESGTVIIDGADVTSTSTEYAAAFATGSGSAIDVISGSLKQTGSNHVTLSIGGGASSTISGGEVYSNASSTVVAVDVGSIITITGGKVWNNVESPAFCAAYSMTGGKIIVSGGEVASTHGAGLVATRDSAVEVRGGTVKSVIAHEGNATATISGGTINGYVSAGSSNAGANNKAEITGGTVLGFLTAVAEKGTITVSGGWFSSKVSGSCLAGGLTATDAISNAPTPAAPYTVGTAYTVTYVDGQGNTLNTFTVLENSSTPTVGNPTRSGFIFSSWSPTVAGTVTANATYTAQWTVILPAPSGTGDEDNGEEIDLGEQETPLSEIPLLFADVTAGDRYRDAVAYVYSKGLMNGYSATTFAPAKSTTRAQIAAILMRLDDGEAPEEAVAFSDVKGGAWYAGAVAWAAENGIMSGYGNGAFGTTDKITREQLVTVLYRYAAGKGYDVSGSADLSVFSDAASVHRYALAAMAWAVDAGILELDGDRIDPTGAAARAEVAEILMRFCEGVAKDGEAELI